MLISVSYLSKINDLDTCLESLEQTNCDYIHCDIMDGVFVPNKTPDYAIIKDQLKKSTKRKDVHLMVKDVKKYIDEYKDLNPEYITFHLETDNVKDMIDYLKSLHIKVGLSIKPNTKVSELIPYLEFIDLVLVMSVEPGFGGQEFINDTVSKIDELYKVHKQNNYNYLIEVDGGINENNAKKCGKADILVAGSFITNSDDYQKQIDKIVKKLD